LLSKGKTLFPPLGLEKQMNILQLNLAVVITSARSTNSPNLVQVSYEMAPPRGGEILIALDDNYSNSNSYKAASFAGV